MVTRHEEYRLGAEDMRWRVMELLYAKGQHRLAEEIGSLEVPKEWGPPETEAMAIARRGYRS